MLNFFDFLELYFVSLFSFQEDPVKFLYGRYTPFIYWLLNFIKIWEMTIILRWSFYLYFLKYLFVCRTGKTLFRWMWTILLWNLCFMFVLINIENTCLSYYKCSFFVNVKTRYFHISTPPSMFSLLQTSVCNSWTQCVHYRRNHK